MGCRAHLLRAALLLLVAAPPALGQLLDAPSIGDAPVTVDADEMEYFRKDSVVEARGDVSVQQGSMQLQADEIRYSHTLRTARATGKVRLRGPQGEILAQQVLMNLEEETGALTDIELHSKDSGYSLWGERAVKACGQTYHIEDGRFTTCRCAEGPPSWSISGSQLDVTVGEYADVRGGRFNILDYPVLYVPRVWFPVELERQSGFLMPRFGASSRRGFQSLLPFYWAIDKSQDATLALDVETSARIGALAEYRYALSRSASGNIGVTYFNESIRGVATGATSDSTIPQNRWSITGEHTQALPAEVSGYADVFLVGDDFFLREINTYSIEQARVVGVRTLPYTESRLGLSRSWERLATTLEATYYQNLAQQDGTTESQTLQRLPEARVWGQAMLGNAAILSLDSSAVSFQRSRDPDGMRVDLQPGLEVPLPIGPYAFGSIRAVARETAYHLFADKLSDGTDLDRGLSREIFRVDADVQSSIGRVFSSPLLPDYKLKHVVEPALVYTFAPSVNQEDLPFFDGVDRANARNQVTYGVATRLLGKDQASESSDASRVRELGRFSVAQTFDIDSEINPISCELGGEEPCAADHFSDVDLAGRVNPSRILSLRFRGNYDTNNSNLTAAQVSFYIEDPRPREDRSARTSTKTSASVGYRFLAPNRLQQIDANLVVELTDWAGFLYSSRYDVVANRFLDNFYGLRFLSQCDCWSLDLTVTDRVNPSELEVRAQVSLVGIGSSESRRRAAFLP